MALIARIAAAGAQVGSAAPNRGSIDAATAMLLLVWKQAMMRNRTTPRAIAVFLPTRSEISWHGVFS